jgi:hypothetical protein
VLLVGREIDPFVVLCVFASEAYLVSESQKEIECCILNLVDENARTGVRIEARGAIPLTRGAATRRDREIEAIVVMIWW